MYALERKKAYIVKTELTKNRTCQSYRWKQVAVCAERKPLDEIIQTKAYPQNWRVEPMADSVE